MQTIRQLEAQVDETFVYFNNDGRAFATRNTLRLRRLLAADDDGSRSAALA